ncbi:flagellar hook-associated protein FlgK [Croceibacterium sp. LX-88]|uniref:Flagellar hook-associated protein 1 n=1 Tax=Croceibacterium selenioxidans TaxID=2838833 RepID=A0ABS5W151_9SPHN|nr:flagellar hook-associated protein FlgK [Croceibacterium selenioxidans]MBT2133201.1 flagellar hook-associated protein FlgK [Croceibacterium selenioxidans]
MASDLLTIAASGTRAARSALDVTAQNIANASTEGYIRRTAQMEEVAGASGFRTNDISLSGVRVAGVNRNADAFRQAEVRRTNSDATRASTELNGLKDIESAVEQADVYTAIVELESALKQLGQDPVDPSLRAATLAAADALAGKFNIAANGLNAVTQGEQFDASAEVDQANVLAGELARINQRLARAGAGSSDQSSLLDQRDLMLEKLSGIANINTTFAADGTVTVNLGGPTGPALVSGNNTSPLAMTTAADGTISFDVGGTAVSVSGGSLSGHALALQEVANVRGKLDTLAASVADTVNAAQAAGVDLDGATGTPLFTGTTAATIALATTDGRAIATAPAGAAAGSRDASNLTALSSALETGGAADRMNSLLFDISSRVSGRQVTSEALTTIASSARATLLQQSGVDLDQEAANLIRFQQAFQASGRAMQVATDIFDTLIGIG